MRLVNLYRKPISMFVMLAFTILLCFWANQSPAAPVASGNSSAAMESGNGEGTGFIEQDEAEPVVKKGKKIPWLVIGAVVVIGAAAVYFLVLNKKFELTVTLGEGCTGNPEATGKYKKNKAVAYSYSTQSGYGNLKVKLDGVEVAASGTVTMDKAHALEVSATHGAAVNIASTPSGAKIYHNYADSGKTTPASFSYTSAGSHTYLLRQCGYQDYTKIQPVVVGQTYNINATMVPGILDNFLAPPTCWVPYMAASWTQSAGLYKCSSTAATWDFSYYNTVFGSSTYTVEAKMRKTEGTQYNSISILLSTSTDMSAINGYLFNYRALGDYSIWKVINTDWINNTGSWTAIKAWTPSSFVNENLNAWNILKIVRAGNNYSFYINNHLLKSFSDATFDPRLIILTFFNSNGSIEIQYDYVRLDVGAALGLMPADATSVSNPVAGQDHTGARK